MEHYENKDNDYALIEGLTVDPAIIGWRLPLVCKWHECRTVAVDFDNAFTIRHIPTKRDWFFVFCSYEHKRAYLLWAQEEFGTPRNLLRTCIKNETERYLEVL